MQKKLPRKFYTRDATIVAEELLGKLLVHDSPKGRLSGIIVETEAYTGPTDKASHAYGNLRSKRTEVMFHKGGLVYMFLIYGMYNCFNVVTGMANVPAAVLIRALEPVEGIEQMKLHRKTSKLVNLCSGPGKLCSALDIDKTFYGFDLCDNKIFIERYRDIPKEEILTSPRINVNYAEESKDCLWRYYVKDSKFVSV